MDKLEALERGIEALQERSKMQRDREAAMCDRHAAIRLAALYDTFRNEYRDKEKGNTL